MDKASLKKILTEKEANLEQVRKLGQQMAGQIMLLNELIEMETKSTKKKED